MHISLVHVSNQELLETSREFEVIDNNVSLKSNLEIKPFSCKYCGKYFNEVHEVKEHIKIHMSISEFDDEKTSLSLNQDCVIIFGSISLLVGSTFTLIFKNYLLS